MKILKFIIVINAVLSFGLMAGEGGVGNGGYSVVCRDENKNIISAELLDIYEGRVRYKKIYKDNLAIDEKIEYAEKNLVKHSRFLSEFQDELAIVKHILKPIPEGHVLMPTEDAFPAILQEGCKFEQVANYTNDGELLVAQKIYDRFDNLSKAALLAHEAVYAIFRKTGAKDSRQARKLVAELFSENPDKKTINEVLELNGKSLTEVCGLSGNLKKRIKNCNKKIGDFVLVSKMHDGFTIYKDVKMNILWSSPFPEEMNYYEALNTCEIMMQKKAGIDNVTWRLPRAIDFSKEDEIRNLFPHKGWVWTSSPIDYSPDFYFLFIARTGFVDVSRQHKRDNYIFLTRDFEGGTAQCVAR